MAPRRALFALLVTLSIASRVDAQDRGWPDCAEDPRTNVTLPNGYPFDPDRAVALYRFHRQQEALQELDAGRAVVRGPWRWRIPQGDRKEVASRLDALRHCLATTEPPQLATLTVRVVGSLDAAGNMTPQEGARVYVEELAVGRTGSDGTLTVRVPSGPIDVNAEIPVNQWGGANVTLAPGQSNVVEIALDDDKEVYEHTTLALAEAIDDILPVTAPSVTLKFIRDGRLAPVNRIDDIEVVDRDDNFVTSIKDQFRVVRGQLVATNPARLLEVLAPQLDEAIVVRAEATDANDGIHTGKMTFRVAQWPLSVRLEAPPSNPGLSVSNIEVGLSLAGGFAVQRVSGTNGRFEIESLPAGPIDFDCETVSDGAHYYCEAILDHLGPASVTVVLRGVKDVVNGVRPLRIEFQDIVRRPSRR